MKTTPLLFSLPINLNYTVRQVSRFRKLTQQWMTVWRFSPRERTIKSYVFCSQTAAWLHNRMCKVSSDHTGKYFLSSDSSVPIMHLDAVLFLTKEEERHTPAVTKQGMSKEWIPLSLSLSPSLCVAAGSALHPDKGVMCWNLASFHYIKHERAEECVTFWFSIFNELTGCVMWCFPSCSLTLSTWLNSHAVIIIYVNSAQENNAINCQSSVHIPWKNGECSNSLSV